MLREVLEKWEVIKNKLTSFFNQSQIIERIKQLEEQIDKYNREIEEQEFKFEQDTLDELGRPVWTPQQKQVLEKMKKRNEPLHQLLTKLRADLDVLQSKDRSKYLEQVEIAQKEKVELENKLVKVKDLIQEQRWNSLKQMFKEGEI